MSGPSNNDRETLGKRLKSRQHWAEIFGWSVGVGLAIEYGNEIVDCFVNCHWPSRELAGGLIVTIGVLGEVLLSRLASTISEDLQARADSDVARATQAASEANERARVAEQATAEANLARAKLETKIAPRYLSSKQIIALGEKLAASEIKLLDIIVHGSTPEVVRYSSHVATALKSGGWNFSSWTLHGREGLAGILVTVADNADWRTMQAAQSLREVLSEFDPSGVLDKTGWHTVGILPDGHVIPPPNVDPNATAAIRMHVGYKTWTSRPPVTVAQA